MYDLTRTRVRVLLASIDRELDPASRPPGDTGPVAVSDALRSAITELAAVLDLGPEPETRSCPICTAKGMRTATVCSNCWSKLSPPDDRPATSRPTEGDHPAP